MSLHLESRDQISEEEGCWSGSGLVLLSDWSMCVSTNYTHVSFTCCELTLSVPVLPLRLTPDQKMSDGGKKKEDSGIGSTGSDSELSKEQLLTLDEEPGPSDTT